MRIVPINAEQSPLFILELAFRLRIRDVMTPNPIVATRRETLRQVKQLMKDNRITGVPIVENRRLFGIVSIDDIIHALDCGTIDDPVEKHMSTQVVVLEEEMPLSMGISYFGKYRYGRFPVLNRHHEVTGIVTSRNVNTSLLLELFKEFNRIEAETIRPAPASLVKMIKVFRLKKYDFENAGKAANEVKRLLQEKGLDPALIRRAAVAAYELEMNLVVHSDGGELLCRITADELELRARDRGPGIANVEQAMQEGFTTASDWIKSMGFGAGMGLPNIRRVADRFDLRSAPSAGTTARAFIRLHPAPAPATREPSHEST